MADVPQFDFSHYYTYDELVQCLHTLAEIYPHLIRLESIGQSFEGREIWLATLTQQQSGPALEKPAYWIDGNTHAGEVTGSAVALYTIHRLLTGYGQEAQITRLLDGYTLYVLPRIAVDGAERYLTTPDKLRSSVRPYPYGDKQAGLHPEDIDGDGLILQMRIQDECGAWKVSDQDPRVMRPRDPAEFGGTYYTILPEGMIHSFDGYTVKIAPRLQGMDFNRNYPHEWAAEGIQPGAGEYPFSEPETRAEAEFWRSHRNINGFVSYHTYSAVILRPYSTHADDHFPVEDLNIYRLIGETGTEITGYKCVSVYHDFRYHPKEIIHGGMDDYGYDHWGWFGFTIELWDLPTEAGVEKPDYIRWLRSHPEEDDLKITHWLDHHLQGEGLIPWHPFDHPQLGPVEIGGWDVKRTWQNAPPQLLPDLCEKHCQFTLAHALMSPRLGIATVDLYPQPAGIYRVVLHLENQGFLPTYTSKKALEKKIVRPIQVILSLPEDVIVISGEVEQEIGHLEGRANKAFSIQGEIDHRHKVEWVIQGAAGSQIEIRAHSERAGTVHRIVELTAEG